MLNLPKGLRWTTFQSEAQCTLLATKDKKAVLTIMLNVKPLSIPNEWLESLFTRGDTLTQAQIDGVLHQQPDEAFMLGKIVCSCFSVREKTIMQAIEQGNTSISGLGASLKCGTNCGSCKTELASLISANEEKSGLSSFHWGGAPINIPVTEENTL